MKIPIIAQIRNRLFVKISLVVAIAIIFVLVIIPPIQRYIFRSAVIPVMQRNMLNYAKYIYNDLGSPPNFEKAMQMSKEMKFKIRYDSPTIKWVTEEDVIHFQDARIEYNDEDKGIAIGSHPQGICIQFKDGGSTTLLVIQSHNENLMRSVHLFTIAMALISSIAILAVYLTVNWLLKPIKKLHEGVKELSRGNIDYQMMTSRSDELGKLVNSFSVMTQSIREMIQAKEQLLLDVSHELRSPLTRVKVALELMDENAATANIREDITEMETMITELLETNRLKSPHGGLNLAPVKLNKLLAEVLPEFEGQKPGVKLVSLPEDFVLNLDYKRICILVRNIIGNALRYSEPEGYPVEISLREKPGEIIIAIQDFGIGIPEQDLPFVFEPFYRVDKSRSKKTGGYGLGMSLSKRIMEAHGGTIEISSRVKVGTTVFLRFKK